MVILMLAGKNRPTCSKPAGTIRCMVIEKILDSLLVSCKCARPWLWCNGEADRHRKVMKFVVTMSPSGARQQAAVSRAPMSL